MFGKPVPAWASSMSKAQFKAFRLAVELAVAKNSLPVDIEFDDGLWQLSSDPAVHGSLLNLMQTVANVPEDHWERETTSFLQRLVSTASPNVDEDPETVKRNLRLRLFHEEFKQPFLTTWSIAQGFITCLVVDRPDAIGTLAKDKAEQLGMTSDELFKLALHNTFAAVHLDLNRNILGEGPDVTLIAGEDMCTSSVALALDRVLGPEPALGRFVSVPTRHYILTADLKDAASLGALNALFGIGQEMYKDGPGSTSPFVYWVKNDKWTVIDVRLEEDGINVYGPPTFYEGVVDALEPA